MSKNVCIMSFDRYTPLYFPPLSLLGEAWRLRGGKYNGVYLSKDRTIEEREQYKKTVEELKSKIKGCPNTRWAIVDGSVVSKGQFSNESKR